MIWQILTVTIHLGSCTHNQTRQHMSMLPIKIVLLTMVVCIFLATRSPSRASVHLQTKARGWLKVSCDKCRFGKTRAGQVAGKALVQGRDPPSLEPSDAGSGGTRTGGPRCLFQRCRTFYQVTLQRVIFCISCIAHNRAGFASLPEWRLI